MRLCLPQLLKRFTGLVVWITCGLSGASADEAVQASVAEVQAKANVWHAPAEIDWSAVKISEDKTMRPDGQLALDESQLRALLDQINFNYPGLEVVRGYYEQGDWQRAGLALVEYYRSKEWAPIFTVDPTGFGSNYMMAELALLDILEQGGRYGKQPRLVGGGIDWEDRGPLNDPEWAWWVNRMGYLLPVTAMWEASGDRRYAQYVDANLADWIVANPYPGKRNFSPAWRPLEVARRIDRSWLFAFIRLRDSVDFSPETRLLVLSSIPDHADALLNYPSFWGNHLLTEKVMLGLLAVAFPEFKDSNIWLEDSVETVSGLIAKQVYPDGTYEELTNHYQLVALLSFQRFLEILQTSDQQAYIDRIKPSVEGMWDYFAYVMRPDGMGPLNNDSDLKNNRAELQSVLGAYNRSDWDYLASAGARGIEPVGQLSRYYPWAGQAIMRDGWTGNAQWAFFDIGPYGSDHHHNDRLHLSVSFGGKDFLVDSGRYSYVPGLARDYFIGPTGHNTVILDGQAPLPGPGKVATPMDVLAELREDRDLFAASVQFPAEPLKGQGPRTHRREVSYYHGLGWIVKDEVIAFGPTEVAVRWLFHPDRVVEAIEGGLVTLDASGANMRMELISDKPWEVSLLRGQTEPFEAGWYSASFSQRAPATQAIYKTMIASPTEFIWLIAPANADWDALRSELHDHE